MNEQEQFLKDTGKDPLDILTQPLDIPGELPEGEKQEGGEENLEAEKDDEEEEGEEGEPKADPSPRNRRERRLMAKLAAERETSIEMAERMRTMAEARATSEEADYLRSVERIYGTDSPEAIMATDILKKAILGAREDAAREAIEYMQEQRADEVRALREADSQLDDIVDELEEVYGVELTDPQERAFFQLLERMSPKDREGNIIEYADAHAVWDVFKDRLQRKPESRAKDLSSRSMNQSGASKESKLTDDSTTRFLKENGII